MWHLYKTSILYSIFSTLLFGVILYLLNKIFYGKHIWDPFTVEAGLDVWFCEFTDMKRFIRQPINTFTNFWYANNAIYFFQKAMSDKRRTQPYNLITANPFYSFLLSGICFYTFICSTFFHSTLAEVASDLDFSAVYSACLFPLMYFTHRLWMMVIGVRPGEKHRKSMTFLIIAFTIIYLILTFLVPFDHTHEIVLVMILLTGIFGFVVERREVVKTNKWYLYSTMFFITIAMVFFKLDTAKILCNPHSLIQPHSVWHLMNGIAVLYLYLYIRSENYENSMHQRLLPLREKYLQFKSGSYN